MVAIAAVADDDIILEPDEAVPIETLPKLDKIVNVLAGRMIWPVHTVIVLSMGGWRDLRAALTVYLKSGRREV